MSEYPEHNKLDAVHEKSQACGEFVNWLDEEKGLQCLELREIVIDGEMRVEKDGTKVPRTTPMWVLPQENMQDMLAEFFGIDRDKLEAEKQAMLATIQGERGPSR